MKVPLKSSLFVLAASVSVAAGLEHKRKKRREEATVADGSECESLEGKWYNGLGSELILTELQGGKLQGEYRTGVERVPGAAGTSFSTMKGSVTKDGGGLLDFSVVYNGGRSAASWIGECKKCGGHDVLHTTWILKSFQDRCIDDWKSTLVNEDVFTRFERVEGPRKDQGVNTPKRPANWVAPDSEKKTDIQVTPRDLQGKWYTSEGLAMDLRKTSDDGTIEGMYSSPSNSEAMDVRGYFDPRGPGKVFGLSGVQKDSSAAKVWVGQYKRCEDGREVLETASLGRSKDASCETFGSSVNYKKMTFLKFPYSS